jgi:hypothetical protein
MKSYVALLAGLFAIGAIGCDVDVADTDREPADVDVIETDEAPAPVLDGPDVDVSSESTEIDAPDVDVDADAPADAAPSGATTPGT